MSAPALELRGIGHRYGGAAVLENVSLALAPGSVTALLGPNGAGKTTLLRAAAGLLAPTAGEVRVAGAPLSALSPTERARRLAVVLRAEPIAFPWTAAEIVLMGRAPYLGATRLESAADRDRAATALARCDAARLADRVFGELSAGEQQRVLIARAICQDTPVLLLDEPTSHLDPAHALAFADIARDLAGEGRALLVVLHDPNLAARAADRLVFLAGGGVAADGPPDAMLTPEVIGRVYGVPSRRVAGAPPAIVLGPHGDDAGQA